MECVKEAYSLERNTGTLSAQEGFGSLGIKSTSGGQGQEERLL